MFFCSVDAHFGFMRTSLGGFWHTPGNNPKQAGRQADTKPR